MQRQFDVVIERDEDGYYVSFIGVGFRNWPDATRRRAPLMK